MKKYLVASLLSAPAVLVVLLVQPATAQTASGNACDVQACAPQLQTTQNLQGQQGPSSANLTPLQPAAQGMSPQDGSQPQTTKLDGINLANEVEPSRPAPVTLPVILALVLCAASLLTLALAADWYFLQGRVVRLLKRRKVQNDNPSISS